MRIHLLAAVSPRCVFCRSKAYAISRGLASRGSNFKFSHVSARPRAPMFQFKFKAALFQLDEREPHTTPLLALPPKIGPSILHLPEQCSSRSTLSLFHIFASRSTSHVFSFYVLRLTSYAPRFNGSARPRAPTFQCKCKAALHQSDEREPHTTPPLASPPKIGRYTAP